MRHGKRELSARAWVGTNVNAANQDRRLGGVTLLQLADGRWTASVARDRTVERVLGEDSVDYTARTREAALFGLIDRIWTRCQRFEVAEARAR